MTSGSKSDLYQSDRDAELLTSLFEKADRILVKKLSNNDRDWARLTNKHQGGVYIPHQHRDGGFFPQLKAKLREIVDRNEIREIFFTTIWPQVAPQECVSRLVHYTSKGQETHLTGLPKSAFAELLPASFVVMGRVGKNESYVYECLTIDSGSDEALLLRDLFDLDADFLIGEFDPVAKRSQKQALFLDFTEQVIAAWRVGNIGKFAEANAAMPPTIELARLAQASFLKKHSLTKIDPFVLEAPGDALREISRSIEWGLFQEYQLRESSVLLVRLLLGDEPRNVSASEVIRRLVDKLPEIDKLMLSASQRRKSRAGISYEHHIEAMLKGGNIPHEKQVIIEAKRRPDFVIPSLVFVNSKKSSAKTGLILSAKTTLRERWKQVEREMGNRRLFLTTVDENIAGNAISDMASIGVYLVIPESLMKSRETEYSGHKNVLTFSDFCKTAIQPNLGAWKI